MKKTGLILIQIGIVLAGLAIVVGFAWGAYELIALAIREKSIWLWAAITFGAGILHVLIGAILTRAFGDKP